jgi:hypothetical protein
LFDLAILNQHGTGFDGALAIEDTNVGKKEGSHVCSYMSW